MKGCSVTEILRISSTDDMHLGHLNACSQREDGTGFYFQLGTEARYTFCNSNATCTNRTLHCSSGSALCLKSSTNYVTLEPL